MSFRAASTVRQRWSAYGTLRHFTMRLRVIKPANISIRAHKVPMLRGFLQRMCARCDNFAPPIATARSLRSAVTFRDINSIHK